MTLPTLTVLLDDGTSTYPLNVTSRVLAADGYSISRGRSDWEGAVTAGELSITFNNSDGYFTIGAGAVFVDQKIKLTETVNGVAYTRFTGYVKSWPTSWPATVVTFSEVSPTATDAQARAERTTLRSMLEEEILSASPTAYYTLGEVEGSTTAGDSSGNQAPPMVIAGTGTAPTFGTGTGPVDGLSAVQLYPDGKHLEATLPTGYVAPGAAWSVLAFFADADLTGAQPTLVSLHPTSWTASAQATIEYQRGQATFQTTGGGAAVPVSMASDNGTHVLAMTYDGSTTVSYYVDGVLSSTTATGAALTRTAQVLSVERALGSGTPVLGTASHVAVHPVALTAGQVASISGVGLSTLTESGTARLTRLAGYANIPVGTLDTSLTNVPVQATSGVSAFAAIQDVADAEGGLVFINGSGNLTFHNRDEVRQKTTPDLTLDKQWVTPDVQPVIDDQSLVNYFEATASATGSVQLARDLTSEAAHGRYPESQTYLVLTDAEALDRANFTVAKLASPSTRYGTLTINLYGMTAAQASTVLAALELDCWLRVTSMASQTPGGTTADVVVEGFTAQTTAESWTITCNVVARSLFDSFILNNATYGVLNTSSLGL